jgi:hypothetical protein
LDELSFDDADSAVRFVRDTYRKFTAPLAQATILLTEQGFYTDAPITPDENAATNKSPMNRWLCHRVEALTELITPDDSHHFEAVRQLRFLQRYHYLQNVGLPNPNKLIMGCLSHLM